MLELIGGSSLVGPSTLSYYNGKTSFETLPCCRKQRLLSRNYQFVLHGVSVLNSRPIQKKNKLSAFTHLVWVCTSVLITDSETQFGHGGMDISADGVPRSYCRSRLQLKSSICLEMNDTNYCRIQALVGYWIGPDFEDGWGYVDAYVSLEKT
ncbi:hypothetical protein O6H91_05G083200 [Diphasiastrum complanatum]|uniref:Uncharacterized protein n=1 Tax=Diphasiastrum complanatum TaxID=34168 RepID=A0ACC2DQB1_DIPCM|nr:hypothetical protein O6H91_05G083200 [Diphasiastrum complanatum]